jgi:hypothetical protein
MSHHNFLKQKDTLQSTIKNIQKQFLFLCHIKILNDYNIFWFSR